MNDWKQAVWENFKAVLWAVFFAVILKTSVVEAYKVPTGSMEDTILVGDFIVGNKFIYGAKIPFTDIRLPAIREPKTGDIVIFEFPYAKDTNYVKRCIAGPGQIVEIKDKIVYVDGLKIDLAETGKYSRPVAKRTIPGRNTPDNFGPYTVPKDCYFMMGDNRDNSYDSRFWGPLNKKYILGEAMFVLWSWADDPDAPDVSYKDPLSVQKLFLYNISHIYERFRFSRLCHDLD